MSVKSLGELRNEDARNLATSVEPGTVDVTITSPPYYDLKNYNDKRQIGLGQDFEHYKNDLKSIFRDVYAVTKSSGSLWLVVDNLRIDGKLVLLPYEMAEWAKSGLNDISQLVRSRRTYGLSKSLLRETGASGNYSEMRNSTSAPFRRS